VPRSGETEMFFMPPEGLGPGGSAEGGVITPSGGELQGIPTARRAICESREATL